MNGIKNIEFKYDDNVHPDPGTEARYRSKINMWLSEMADELNTEDVIVEYRISKRGNNRPVFKNISPQLYRKVITELNRFDMFADR